MAFHYKTQGIILKKREQGEANRIVTVFSKEFGKLTLWAASERKIASKLRAGLELFSLSRLSFVQGKSKKLVVEAVPVEQRFSVFRDPSRFQAALRLASLVDQHIALEERDEKLWELLLEAFALVEKEAFPQKVEQSFAPRLLSLAGYGKESGS